MGKYRLFLDFTIDYITLNLKFKRTTEARSGQIYKFILSNYTFVEQYKNSIGY